MTDVDVLVLGGGPAGAIAAIALASRCRVLFVDRRFEARPRIGESLAPAARRILSALGLGEAFLAERHAPCHANVSVWGSAEPQETDFLRDPDGTGWHLDRARFDAWLRREARLRGASFVHAALRGVARDDARWRIDLEEPGGRTREITASFLIDAGGPSAPIARRLGARRTTDDRLVCGWTHVPTLLRGPAAGLTYVFAVHDGWWYTAPIPGDRRVLAFHTDADLPAAIDARGGYATLRRAAAEIPMLRDLVALSTAREAEPGADFDAGFSSARGSWLGPWTGEGWAAAGDAALTFDPLSSQGIFNALVTGKMAADAALGALAGDLAPRAAYARTLDVRARYRSHMRLYYGAERRFTSSPFWRRRQALGLVAKMMDT